MTDAKDQSLKGNFAMCYGIMVEFARSLERLKNESVQRELNLDCQVSILRGSIQAKDHIIRDRDRRIRELEAMLNNETRQV
jgi:hypothetical protein